MSCGVCGSTREQKFESEVTIHFPKLKDIDKHPMVLAPELFICLDCGRAEFVIPGGKLARLAEADAIP